MRPARILLVTTTTAILVTAGPALAAGGLSAAQALSGAGSAVQPDVAVGASGRTAATWSAQGKQYHLLKGRIDARLGRVGGAWAATQTLSGSGGSPLAAVGADGVAAVAWATEGANRTNTIFVAVARSGHSFGRRHSVAAGTGVSAPAGLEVQPDGRVVVVFTRGVHVSPPLSREESLDYVLVSPAGAEVHGSLGLTTGIPSLAETSTGTILLASSPPPYAPTVGPPSSGGYAQAASLAPGASAFTTPQKIYAALGNPSAGPYAIGAFAGSGGAAVGMAVDGIQPNALELAPLDATGGFGMAFPVVGIDISNGRVGYAGPVAALPGGGDEVAAYTLQQLDNPTDEAVVSAQVMAAVLPPGLGLPFGTPQRLSGATGIPSAPLAASAGSTSVVLWGQSAGCTQTVYAAVRPAGGTFGPASALAPRFTTQHVVCGNADNTQLSLAGAGRYLIAGWLEGSAIDVATLSAP
ncbi:MAG TPA: hypothetical protein VG165_06680 [Solirubrobacteraceae bacterium]|jgi:hypothetical protein|nr:hypothetical protein [Solirubrobacteraceae bacterium]